MRISRETFFIALTCLSSLCLVAALVHSTPVLAASAEEINIKVDAALKRFQKEVPGGEDFLNKAISGFPKSVVAI